MKPINHTYSDTDSIGEESFERNRHIDVGPVTNVSIVASSINRSQCEVLIQDGRVVAN